MTKADFEKKNPGLTLVKMGPKWPKSGVFGHFLDFESLDFSDFVYNDRLQLDLAGTGGYCTQKIGSHFGPVFLSLNS